MSAHEMYLAGSRRSVSRVGKGRYEIKCLKCGEEAALYSVTSGPYDKYHEIVCSCPGEAKVLHGVDG